MSEANQEPTMEEILASIRRIISEDDPPADGEAPAPAAEAAPVEEPRAVIEEPLAPAEEDDEVLELTQRIEPEPVAHEPLVETHGDLDTYRERQPEPEAFHPAPRAEEAPAWSGRDEEPLIGRGAAATAATAFGQLAQSLAMPKEGRTLEDVVQELLRPLLKTWLDEHLPDIVKAKVEAEVERIARTRGR